MQALRNTHKRNRPGHSAMNALTDPPPPPLIFSTKHDRKKEGDKTKDGANICRPKARDGLQLVLSKQNEEIQSLQAELDLSLIHI